MNQNYRQSIIFSTCFLLIPCRNKTVLSFPEDCTDVREYILCGYQRDLWEKAVRTF
jgi:hypothetical protein